MSYAFDVFFAEFRFTDMWKRMQETVEASPWHREENVAVHTEMVLEQYRTRFSPFRSEVQNLIAQVALLFHDVGKPAAEEVLEKKDGSGDKYRRYAGHEQDSAVAFTEEYVKNKALRELITPVQARVVRWIIEHHLPYGLKDREKVNGLRIATKRTLGKFEETFYDCLRSDAAGRISDDHAEKLQNVETWIANFKAADPIVVPAPSAERRMYVLIGPSGSGKSTWTAEHFKQGDAVLSLDNMRLQFLVAEGADKEGYESPSEAYAHAWKYATENESRFNAFIAAKTRETMDMLKKTGGNVFIDNVNASKKRRAQWVQLGRANGMFIVAVEFWNTTETLLARQKTRGDKEVPAAAVIQHQNSMSSAWLGAECDDVVLVVGEQE